MILKYTLLGPTSFHFKQVTEVAIHSKHIEFRILGDSENAHSINSEQVCKVRLYGAGGGDLLWTCAPDWGN